MHNCAISSLNYDLHPNAQERRYCWHTTHQIWGRCPVHGPPQSADWARNVQFEGGKGLRVGLSEPYFLHVLYVICCQSCKGKLFVAAASRRQDVVSEAIARIAHTAHLHSRCPNHTAPPQTSARRADYLSHPQLRRVPRHKPHCVPGCKGFMGGITVHAGHGTLG